MKSLYDAFNDVATETTRWCYFNNANGLDVGSALKNNNEAWIFIEDYFKGAGKEYVFEDFLQRDFSKLKNRALHTVSTFFLGIVLAEKLQIDRIFIKEAPDSSCTFLYIWFLTCLYHDYGYVYEHDDELKKISSLNKFMKNEKIEYKLKNYSPYNKKIIDLYYSYRKNCDHGIVGGILLYDRLGKNYELALKKAKTLPAFTGNVNDFVLPNNGRNLRFKQEHFGFYSEAARAIIAHNIWKGTLDSYIKKSNDNRTKKIKFDSNNRKFNLNVNSLLFLLAIADTIEPIKRFQEIKPKHVLENISINLSLQDEVSLSVNCPWFETSNYFSNIKGLEKWLEVRVENLDDKTIKIRFNSNYNN